MSKKDISTFDTYKYKLALPLASYDKSSDNEGKRKINIGYIPIVQPIFIEVYLKAARLKK